MNKSSGIYGKKILRKPEVLLGILLFLSGCVIFREYLFGGRLMVFQDMAGDVAEQYVPQYVEVVNRLRQGDFTVWTFHEGLGVNQLNLNLFDPSLMLMILSGVLLGTERMLHAIAWIQLFRVVAAGLACHAFLKEFSFDREGAYAASYVYGLSGYLLIWGQHLQFGMVTIYLPLMLLFAERALQKRKGRGWFPVLVFLCSIYGVYLTYMSLIAVGLFLFFRSVSLPEISWKEKLLRFLSACLQILLGLGMAMVLFLPQLHAVTGVSFRTGSRTGWLSWLKKMLKPFPDIFYRSLFSRLFSTNLENRFAVGGSTYLGWGNYFEAPVVFFSLLFPFLLAQFLWKYRKAETGRANRAAVYLTVLLAAAAMLLPIGGSVFNAFLGSAQRYTFVLLPFFAMIMAWVWGDLRKGGRVSLLLLFAVFCAANHYIGRGAEQCDFAGDVRSAILLELVMELMCVTLASMALIRREGFRRKTTKLLLILLVCNMVVEGSTCYADRVSLLKEDTPAEDYDRIYLENEKLRGDPELQNVIYGVLHQPQKYFRDWNDPDVREALRWIRENDPEFVREEKAFQSTTLTMDPMMDGYYGVCCYNGILNGNVKEFFLRYCPDIFFADQNRVAFWNICEDSWMASFLGVRYLLSREPRTEAEGYALVETFGEIGLYRTVRDTGMAHFYTDTASESSDAALVEKYGRDAVFDRVLLLEDGEERETLPEAKTDGGDSVITLQYPEKDDHLVGSADITEDGFALFMIPYEKGWSVLVDGEEAEVFRGDIGFLACRLSAGSHTLELNYEIPYLKEGAVLSAVFWVLYFFWMLCLRKRNRS